MPFWFARSGSYRRTLFISLWLRLAGGGTTDILARVIGQKRSENQVRSAQAPAQVDGQALFMATMAHALAPRLYKKPVQRLSLGFEPLDLVATTPQVLPAHPSLPVSSVPEWVADISAQPGEPIVGEAGVNA